VTASFVLTLACPDRTGIVAVVASDLAAHGYTINDSQQYADVETGSFFLRIEFSTNMAADLGAVRGFLTPTLDSLGGEWKVFDSSTAMKVVVMVSSQGHVLNHLLYSVRSGRLPVEVVAVISNHRSCEPEVRWHGIDFHYLPVDADTKTESEQLVLSVMERSGAEALVLARYMQILSDDMCRRLTGRAINIHHSLLPSFKGARPYEQAHRRGVKVIGATAHYVTSQLDEGPIITQEFVPVDHRLSATDLAHRGQDLEARALVHALAAHAQHRVMLNGIKTVVFD
jgi:formyltetrahydrofolate deformylase